MLAAKRSILIGSTKNFVEVIKIGKREDSLSWTIVGNNDAGDDDGDDDDDTIIKNCLARRATSG